MGRDARQEAFSYLLEQAEKQGYITFDNIMDCAEAYSLPIQDFDWLSNSITTRGILVYDEMPVNRISSTQDDENYDDYAQTDYEMVYNHIIELDEALREFVEEVRNIVPPQRKELNTLKYQVIEGNQHARKRMIEMHLRIALRIALQRAEMYDLDIVDTVGEACVGLIMAVDKYNPDTKGAFGSYAAMWILQNISRKQPTRRPLMHYPAYKKALFFSAYPILKECGFIDNPEWFNIDDIKMIMSERLIFTNEQTEDVIAAATPFESYENLSLMFLENDDVFEKHDFEEDVCVPISRELVFDANIDQYIEEIMTGELLAKAFNTLTDKEKRVLELRYGLKDGREKTLEEVGIEFNVTRERIRQIEVKALRKLGNSSQGRELRDIVG